MSLDRFNTLYDERLEERLNERVEAFEDACEQAADVDVASFLPDTSDEAYETIGVELLRVDLQRSWQDDQPRWLGYYQNRFPGILGDPSRLTELAFEEYRMRRISGHEVEPGEYADRYDIDTTNWPRVDHSTVKLPSASTSTVFDRVKDKRDADSRSDQQTLPKAGDYFLDFELLAELGHGAFAKVFLARQPDLADRKVVLKITTVPNVEAQQLARLQHTNIVPIYSRHRDPDAELYAICMPDFGPCTLNDAIKHIRDSNDQSLDGHVFARAIRRRESEIRGAACESHVATSINDQAASRSKISYVNACVLICRQVAEALRHSHDQNIVHRDLKPANVLLASHGPVMLLDFNLSDELDHEELTRSIVGGTLPYASPEHLRSLLTGERIGAAADIYSLGVILYQLLSGRLPFPARPGSTELTIREMIADRQTPPNPVSSFNPSVSTSLDGLVNRLLASSPELRYQSADQVREDLQRHLDDRPLRFAPNKSVVERARKWKRRHPRLSFSLAISTVATVLTVVALTMFFQARNVIREQILTAGMRLREDLPRVCMATSVPDADESLLRRGLLIGEERLAPLEEFMSRAEIGTASVFPSLFTMSSSEDTEILQDICQCLYLMSNARMQLPERAELIDALKVNRRAYSMARNAGFDRFAQSLEQQAARIRSIQAGKPMEVIHRHSMNDADQSLVAISLVRERRYPEALRKLESLRANEPFNMSLWFLMGVCYSQSNQFHEAEGCFTTCVVAQSDFLPAHFYRGLCRLDLKKYLEAESDFTNALNIDSTFIPALINRSVARKELHQYELGRQDLDDALGLGAPQTRIYFMRSELRKILGDRQGAKDDYQKGLNSEPTDEQSFVRRGVAMMNRQPERALDDFKRAALTNPRSYAAHRNWAYVLGELLDRPAEAIRILDGMLDWVPQPHAELISRSVMYARMGNEQAATKDAREALAASRDPKTVFQAACVYAITSSPHNENEAEAVKLLAEAITADANWKDIAKTDKDLDNIRSNDEFQRLIGKGEL